MLLFQILVTFKKSLFNKSLLQIDQVYLIVYKEIIIIVTKHIQMKCVTLMTIEIR